MDSATALSVLKRVLCHLPTGLWWKLHQKTAHELGVATAFNLPMADVNALLALSGVGKMTAQGFCTKQSKIDEVCDTSDGCLRKGENRRVPFVSNASNPPFYKSPALQAKCQVRCPPKVKLPDDLIAQLKLATQVYEKHQHKSALQEQVIADSKARAKSEEIAKLQREKARAIQYPVLSQVIAACEELSLSNPKVKKWAKDAMIEKFAPWRKRRLLHVADNVQLPSAQSTSSSACESSDDDSESSDDDKEEMMTIAQLK